MSALVGARKLLSQQRPFRAFCRGFGPAVTSNYTQQFPDGQQKFSKDAHKIEVPVLLLDSLARN